MRRRKYFKKLKYLAPVVFAGAVAAFIFLNHSLRKLDVLPPSGKPAMGYKTEDRRQLEQLIHAGTKND